MNRAFRLLAAAVVILLSLLFLVPAGVVSSGPLQSTMIGDYWPMDLTGSGALIYVSADGTVWYGHGPWTGNPDSDSVVNDVGVGGLSWGDSIDRSFVGFYDQTYGVWDLGVPYSSVAVFPYIDDVDFEDHFRYEVWGSNDFDISKPLAATWTPASMDEVYVKGWSSAGEGLFEVCNDDYVCVWNWLAAAGGTQSYRFVKVLNVPHDVVQYGGGKWGPIVVKSDSDIDAVKGVLSVKEVECGDWVTDVVERGRTFSYTSLDVGPDDRVHVAYGGDQLYYAVRDGSTWHVDEVDKGGKGAYCSLALNDDGYPAISYYDAANGDLKYAYQTGTLNDVWGTSASNVYAVGDAGSILRYDGTDWSPMANGSDEDLYGIWGSGYNNVFAVGAGGTILRCNGSGWSQMSVPPATPDLYGVWGNSATDVYAVGAGGTILHYNGVSWTAMSSGTAQALQGVWGASATNVFAVGDAGTIRRYDGVSWTSMNSSTSLQLSAVWGSSASDVYAVGDGGVIRRYAGSGVNWTAVSSPVTDCLGDVWGTSASDVFAVGCRGTVIHFGGSSWSRMVGDTTDRLNGVWGSSASNVVAVGYEGAITGYDGTIWAEIASGNGWLTETVDSAGDVGRHTSLAFNSGNPAISYYDATNASLKYAVWSPSAGTWLKETVDSQDWVGEYTSLAFDNLGRPAISYYDATNEDLRLARWDGSCWVIPYPSVVDGAGLVDSNGDVGRYSSLAFDELGNPSISYHDATLGSLKYARWNGSSWQIETVDDSGWVGQYSSLGFDASGYPGISYYDALNQDLKYASWTGISWDVAIVDEEGNVGSCTSVGFDSVGGVAISYYDATNDAVKVAYRGSDASLSAVWGASLSSVFTVGDYGTIRWYNGHAWPPMAAATVLRLNGIWGASSSDIYAVGDGGVILHYNGSAWSLMPIGTTQDLYGIWGSGGDWGAGDRVYVVGAGGVIGRYNGSTWTGLSSGTTNALRAVWGTTASNVIAVGDCGTILHYDGSSWTPRTSGVSQCLLGVWGGSLCSGIYVVGCDGTILRSDDCAGVNWFKMTSGTTLGLSGIWGTTNSNVIAVGEQGTILGFNGTQWSAMASGTKEWLRGAWGSSSSNVFAVGDAGTILTFDGSSWSLMHTGRWTTETVDPYPWAGRFSSLAFDPANNPGISFYDAREGDLKYAHWQKDHWAIDTVDSYGDVGKYTSLAFDGSGNPCISYYEVSRGNLKYAQWNGTSWDVSVPDSVGDVGSYSSLAFDSAGNPAISYYDATTGDLKYTHFNGTTWVVAVPDSEGDVGSYSSLGFDGDGNPAIGYYDATNEHLKYAHWNGSSWVIDIVDRAGGVGRHCSMHFDCLGNPAISYYDAANGDLKYAHWSGTSWELQVVDSEGQVGMYTSLDFDDMNYPAISYYDGTKGALKLARWNGEIWDLVTIDDLRAAGHLTSLAFDQCRSLAISYDSAITGDLKYASPANPKPDQPVNKSPAEGETYVSLAPTLVSEAFSDPCPEPSCPDSPWTSHRASQWMIMTENCDVNCGPVFDSGVDETNLVQIEVPAGLLEPLATYYWCVRHQDCRGAWSEYSEKTAFTTASPPEQPVNVSPGDGTASVSLTPTLEASAFTDPEKGDKHIASQWQITTSSDNYSAPLFDQRVERTSLTRLEIPEGMLANRTTYYWRVRYQDNHGTWSEFSLETSFTTNSAPETPANQQPSDGEGKVSRTPTLEASSFADSDVGESHLASQWRVTKTAGDYSTPVFDSGVDTSNLTQMTIPAKTLEHDTSYYWQVRYQDSQGSWSNWSAETGFKTGSAPAVPAGLIIAAAAVAVVAVVAMTAPMVAPL